MSTVSVSILAFHNADTIRACIESVLDLEHEGELDIHVREQGPDDEQSREIELAATSSSSPNAFTLERGENEGFARGHNRAIRKSRGEFVLLVNSDACLEPAYLREALPYFGDPRVGSVQGKLLAPIEDASRSPSIDTTGFLATRRRLFLPRGQGEEDHGQFDRPEEIFGVDGAVALYRRSALDDIAVPRALNPAELDNDGVEYLDETYFMYKCDLDLAWRLQLRGWRSMYAPSAVSYHDRTLKRGTARSPRELLRQRKAGPAFTRAFSFCNHRLTLIKNDRARQLLRDGARWLPAEAAAWTVAIGIEHLGSAVKRFARLARYARHKRALIQARRDPSVDPYVHFVP
jgi:GT2 family glycosyltransferase